MNWKFFFNSDSLCFYCSPFKNYKQKVQIGLHSVATFCALFSALSLPASPPCGNSLQVHNCKGDGTATKGYLFAQLSPGNWN